MLIDLHVHTNRYSACGRSSPQEMIVGAIEAGLDAVAFTEHNILWPRDELDQLQEQYPQIALFRGVELSSAEGEDLLVHGILDADLFTRGLPIEEIMRMTREKGGAVILAHPYRFHPTVPDILERMPPDAVETRSINIFNYAHRLGEELARRLALPTLGTSDGHHADELGFYATEVMADVQDEHELAQALRCGAFRLWCDDTRIVKRNANLQAKFVPIRKLFEQGYDDSAVREALPEFVTNTFVQGLRQNRDVLMPTCPKHRHN